MKPNLIIFDEPLFYTEGLSKLLTEGEIFDNVRICNSTATLSEQLSYQPPEFLMLGSRALVLTEIYKLVQDLVNQHQNIKIIVIGNFLTLQISGNYSKKESKVIWTPIAAAMSL